MPVIVAVDRDRPEIELVQEGAKLADAFGEELQIVHAMSRETFRSLEEQSVEETGKTVSMDDVREMAREVAEDAATEAGVEATAVGLVGDPEDAVAQYAEKEDASYLVVGGRKRSAVGKAIFGSATQAIILNSDVPVVTVIGDQS